MSLSIPNVLFPCFILLWLSGCLGEVGPADMQMKSGCHPTGTVGEYGRVYFDLDYGGSFDYSAGNGQVWAVGAVESLVLRDYESLLQKTDIYQTRTVV